jgi:hypothetical protein
MGGRVRPPCWSHIEESIVQRTKAYSGSAAAGAARRAAYCAWMLFYEHQPAGRDAVAYVNFMDADDQHRVRANYRGNHARLTALKRRHDPGNLFRLNHNIVP